MKKTLVIFIVGAVSAVGGAAYLHSRGVSLPVIGNSLQAIHDSLPRISGSLGVSQTSPLGEFETMDSYLVGLGLKKQKRTSAPSSIRPARLKKGPIFSYSEHDKARAENMRYDATIAADLDGVIYGVHAAFWSGSKEATNSSKVAEFAEKMWLEAAGAKPEFEATRQGSGVSAQLFFVASFDKDGIRGTWRKRYLRYGDDESIVDEVSLSTE